MDWFLEPQGRARDAAAAAAAAAARVRALELKVAKGNRIPAGDALFGASARRRNATLARRSHLGATAE